MREMREDNYWIYTQLTMGKCDGLTGTHRWEQG